MRAGWATVIVIGVSAVALGACGGDEADDSATAASSSADGSAITTVPGGPASSVALDPLPGCAGTAVDCRLAVAGEPGLGFDVRYLGAGPATVSVEVRSVSGDLVQKIEEPIDAASAALPTLVDLDGDGSNELLIPRSTGNVNTEYAVWALPAGAELFVRSGEVAAFAFARSEEYVVAQARGAADVVDLHFLQMADGVFVPVATAEVTATPDASGAITTSCTVIDDGGLTALALDETAAADRFCNDPLVAAAF